MGPCQGYSAPTRLKTRHRPVGFLHELLTDANQPRRAGFDEVVSRSRSLLHAKMLRKLQPLAARFGTRSNAKQLLQRRGMAGGGSLAACLALARWGASCGRCVT